MAERIFSMAILEALPGKEDDLLNLLRELYTLMHAKGYCRDALHRDAMRPDRFLHLRYWTSTRRAARREPTPSSSLLAKLPDLCTIPIVYEILRRCSKVKKTVVGRALVRESCEQEPYGLDQRSLL